MKIEKKYWLALILTLIGLISFLYIAPIVSTTEFHAENIAYLTEKTENVLALTASSAGISTLITLIPGDVGNPIAEQLADFNFYFILLLCALYLEKYLLTITGLAAFKFIIPIACGLGILSLLTPYNFLKRFAFKIALFGTLIFAIVPTSLAFSKCIDNTYQYNVQETIEEANQITQDAKEENDNWFHKITKGTNELLSNAKGVLNNFVESIAVMIITSCIIPILVFLSFMWVTKGILGINMNIPKIPLKSTKRIGHEN